MSEPKLFRKNVKFPRIDGSLVEVEAVYEDSNSVGSSTIGTVVAIHGSPGSHNDFKYIRDKLDGMQIRFIGINLPGFKNTPIYENQDFGNEERQNFAQNLLDQLDLSGNIIYMGHSRGCENALMTSVNRNSHGLILINPIGLRPHKGIRPSWVLQSAESLYDTLPRSIADYMMEKLYLANGFKVQDGEEAINALRSMNRCAIEKQLEYIEKLNNSKTKLLFLYAGKDHLMEKEVMAEALEKYKGLQNYEFEKNINDEEANNVFKNFVDKKGASVFVEKDSHFQNKQKAEFIANACQSLFSTSLINRNKI